MLKLPKIPYTMDKDKQQVVSMGNVNYSKMTQDGDIADSSGISGRHFPYIATAKERAPLEGLGEGIVSATYFRGKWATVDGDGILSYGGDVIGPLEIGEKQFAAINTKLVIMPDKKYLDASGETARLKDLGAEAEFIPMAYTTDSISIRRVSETLIKNITLSQYRDRLTVTTRQADEGLSNCFIMVDDFDDSSWKFSFIDMLFKNYAKFQDPQTIILDRDLPISTPMKVCLENDASGYVEWNTIYDITFDRQTNKYHALLVNPFGGYWTESEEIPITIFSVSDNFYCPNDDSADIVNAKLKNYQFELYINMFLRYNDDGLPQVLVSKRMGGGSKLTTGILYNATINNGSYRTACIQGATIKLQFEKDKKYEISGTVTSTNENSFTLGNFTSETISTLYSLKSTTFSLESALRAEIFNSTTINLNDLFVAGDTVELNDNGTGTSLNVRIASINEDGDMFTVTSNAFSNIVFEGPIKIERRIPHMDYICEHGNRLYGCSNADQTIYVSALGDPTNIYAYEGVSTDSYAVAVAGEGNFTGCCAYDGGVMFWKEHKLHKLLGSYPAEYALYEYNIDGVQEGSHKSLQNIGEVLFYKGERGVFAFDGSPRLISENFGEKRFTDAVAGNDGECYYISMKDKEEKQHFFSYNTRTGLWVREGDMAVTEFIRTVDGMHMLEDGKVYLYGAEETGAGSEWFVQFAPIYETIEGKKSYSRIKMRIELPKESHMVVSVRCDGGRWAECGKIVGRVAGVVPVMVPINRCDKFELKISGKGPCTIHSILREYFVGSDNR